MEQPAITIDAPKRSRLAVAWEIWLLWLLMFVHGGELPPGINEAHYLVKSKSFWDPQWCQGDLFLASGKAHVLFDLTFGALTTFLSLPAAAWVGRAVGWLMLSVGLAQLSWRILPIRYASLWIGLLWMVGVDAANLAGEWVVGGIEAKVPAYALLFIGIERWLSQRPERAWVWLGAASAFHVLVGGWAVIALGIVTCFRSDLRRTWLRHLPWLIAGGVLSLIGLIPALQLNSGVSSELASQAARIYTFERISHHLLGSAFQPAWYFRFGSLLIATCVFAVLARPSQPIRKLSQFTAAACAIALTGLVIGLFAHDAPDLVAQLLRFYWFRLSDVAVPLCGAAALVVWAFSPASAIMPSEALRRRLVWPHAILALAVVAASVWEYQRWHRRTTLLVPASVMTWEQPSDARYINAAWRAVCDWVEANTPEDAVFLTPKHQQTFKWYTGRPEVVAWKDVPQDAASLVEWSQRMQEVFPPHLSGQRVSIRYDRLRELRQKYGARYLVIDRRRYSGSIPLVRVYPKGTERNAIFEVYQLLSVGEVREQK